MVKWKVNRWRSQPVGSFYVVLVKVGTLRGLHMIGFRAVCAAC